MTDLPLPTEQSRCYDNTRLGTYKTCPRMYFISHVLGWGPESKAAALDFGSCWHAGMDAIWGGAHDNTQKQLHDLAITAFNREWESQGRTVNLSLADADVLSPRTPRIAHEMQEHYISHRWRMLQESDLISGEQPFAVPLPNMEDVWLIGRLDKVIQYAGQTVVLEHKSTTAYATVGNFRTDYVDSWFVSSQVKGYQFGAGLYYPSVSGVWVDAALVHKKIHNAFKLIPVAHSFPLLDEWVSDAEQWANRVRTEEDNYKQEGKLTRGMFPKNEDQCYQKYGPCKFLDLCRSCADPSALKEIPPGYVSDKWEPFSIVNLDKLIRG